MSNRRAIGARHHTIFRMIYTIFRIQYDFYTIFIRLFPLLTLRWLPFLPPLSRLLRSLQPMHAIAPNVPGRFHSHPALRIAF